MKANGNLEINNEDDAFRDNQRKILEEVRRIKDLIQKYKSELPPISAHWDLSSDSVHFNEIPEHIQDGKIAIFDCDMDSFLTGIFNPAIFEPDTLWTTMHWDENLAKIIEAWEKKQKVSPVFLTKYDEERKLAVVFDGKHRLTVARAIKAASIPFMVGMDDVAWVEKTFPSACKLSF